MLTTVKYEAENGFLSSVYHLAFALFSVPTPWQTCLNQLISEYSGWSSEL